MLISTSGLLANDGRVLLLAAHPGLPLPLHESGAHPDIRASLCRDSGEADQVVADV
ncbi:MAG: hypothetical protein WCJ67_02115 [Thermoleophilia bacterium]